MDENHRKWICRDSLVQCLHQWLLLWMLYFSWTYLTGELIPVDVMGVFLVMYLNACFVFLWWTINVSSCSFATGPLVWLYRVSLEQNPHNEPKLLQKNMRWFLPQIIGASYNHAFKKQSSGDLRFCFLDGNSLPVGIISSIGSDQGSYK